MIRFCGKVTRSAYSGNRGIASQAHVLLRSNRLCVTCLNNNNNNNDVVDKSSMSIVSSVIQLRAKPLASLNHFRALHTSSAWLDGSGSSNKDNPDNKLNDVVPDTERGRIHLACVKPFLNRSPRGVKIVDKIFHEIDHYKTGFALLWAEIRTSSRLLYKMNLQGQVLSRRERKQLIRTSSDLLRLVPFSVFVLIPFMEIFLPVALKLFPGMLPSTFDTSQKVESRRQITLKRNIEMAKFLQDTMEELAESNKKKAENIKFSELFSKIRDPNTNVAFDDVKEFFKVFKDDLTLDKLSRQQLSSLCRMIDIPPIGTTIMLRFQLSMKMRALRADDLMIQREGIENMTVAELQNACQERGMRSIGLSLERLRKQMDNWIILNLNEGIPTSMVLLSRALIVSEQPDTEAMTSTLANLGENLVSEASIIVGEKMQENKRKLQIIEEENIRIREEEEEGKKAKAIAEAKAKQQSEQLQQLQMNSELLLDTGSHPTDVNKTLEALPNESTVSTEQNVIAEAQRVIGEIKESKKIIINISNTTPTAATTIDSGSSTSTATTSTVEQKQPPMKEQATEQQIPIIKEIVTEISTGDTTSAMDSEEMVRLLDIVDKAEDDDTFLSQAELSRIVDAVESLTSRTGTGGEKYDLQTLLEDREVFKKEEQESKAEGLVDKEEETKSKKLSSNITSRLLDSRIEMLIKNIDKEIDHLDSALEKKQPQDTAVLKQFDLDHDGVVTVDELITSAKTHKKGLKDDKLRRVAKMLDINGDGKVSMEEVTLILKELEKQESDITVSDITKTALILKAEALAQKIKEEEEHQNKA